MGSDVSLRWLIAKYTPDPMRGEPVNVGVILIAGDRVLTRFVGERSGAIDGRTIRGSGIRVVETYKAWVDYWRGLIEDKGTNAEHSLLMPTLGSNYFIVPGGERMVGGDVETPEEMIASLFVSLVERDDVPVESESTARLAEKVLQQLAILDVATPNFEMRVHGKGNNTYPVRFDFRFDNGAANLMRRVTLASDDARAWGACQSAAWAFEKVSGERLGDLETRCIAMVRPRDGDDLAKQIDMLGEYATVVMLDDIPSAVQQLRTLFHMEPAGDA